VTEEYATKLQAEHRPGEKERAQLLLPPGVAQKHESVSFAFTHLFHNLLTAAPENTQLLFNTISWN
jgi:hypothetical protein